MDIDKISSIFDKCGIEFVKVNLDNEWTIIVSQHGGHIYGPFSRKCVEGLFWMPEAFECEEDFKQLFLSKSWNTGGDRVWIAPEIQFNITDRRNFRETLNTPKSIDPGNYELYMKDNRAYLRQSLQLESFNTVKGVIKMSFNRCVLNASNPLRNLEQYCQLMKGIDYCGFEQILDLECFGEDQIYAECWDLLQIKPGGTVFIPMFYPSRGVDHYEPAGNNEYYVENGVCLKITGNERYKIAYKSAFLMGRFGYLSELKDGNYYLIIKNYPNNPSCMYSEEPPLIPGDKGYSVHIYNDDGESGGFAEMECNMQTIGNPAGIKRAVDRLTTWIYIGKKEGIANISSVLLGYDFSLK